MSDAVLRECKKLEVRLESYQKKAEAFMEESRRFLERYRGLWEALKDLKKEGGMEVKERILKLRREALMGMVKLLLLGGELVHARSHLAESHSALIEAVEEALAGVESTT